MFAGCIAAGIYATNAPEACHYITEHSKAEVLALENNKQLIKYNKCNASQFPHLKAIVMWEEAIDKSIAELCCCPVYSWEDFMALGSEVTNEDVDSRMMGIKPGHCSTLIYTSGTTGPPKAVMISHDNITWTISNMMNHIDLNHTDRVASYLPLSHIAAQAIDIHVPMVCGCCTYFCQPDALKGTLTVTLKEVRPTFFFGVPRVWEKIQEKMSSLGRASTGLKKSIGTWAKNTGTAKSQAAQFGNKGGKPWGFGCANSIVLSKIKDALGLDQCKCCYTAAAPIAVEVLNYFASLDIPIYEVFGQSECTGPHTISDAKQWKIGTCGRPMEGTETIIAKDTLELCYRGRHIFMGYMYMPEKTAETIDEHGYLHSGDVSDFDADNHPRVPGISGFMHITGRIKELIITAGGENIPPVLIENEMKAAMLAISNCMVIGDKRKYLSMLVSLKTEADKESGAPTDVLAGDSLFEGARIGSSAKTLGQASVDPLWIAYINAGMKKANGKTTSSAQIVQKWKLLPVDFSEKAGELTPTLKLKRNVVADIHSALIDSLYE
jgi:long-chain-fatty-acid--CoA ligase ACSBG